VEEFKELVMFNGHFFQKKELTNVLQESAKSLGA
jgi:hypothetical protein